jgi:asparagine synthase (glutamine-hydrolysing)
MCGIYGEVRTDDGPPDMGALGAATACMTPRGPDAAGSYRQGPIALGHRRLSIIDLSPSAAQPMVDPHLGTSIVFNGCIYNYPELRKQLEGKGYRFFSHNSDTEVILKAYDAWGEKCVEHFNGMFAFVIVHRDDHKVFMARDRLGIKPLYYACPAPGSQGPPLTRPLVGGPTASKAPAVLRFASSLPALLSGGGGGIDTSLDPVGLHHYMTWHAVVPPPYTVLQGVRKLPPATTLTIHPDGQVTSRTYWQADFNPREDERGYSFDDWKQRVLHELEQAIQRRMVADVPVGCLLSGGLDSSLVVGLLARGGQTGLNTFSIGLESVGGEAGDEFEYSDIIAERFATDHHKIRVDSSRALPELDKCIAAMSEPMVSHDCIGFYLLSEEVAKHVKVVQSGQGADEVFAGYHWYPPMLSASSSEALDVYRREFFDRDHAELAGALDPSLVGADHSGAFLEAHFGQPGADAAIDKALRLDTTTMLIDDPVKRVDNMTMAWGLEARVPFLDHELVELAGRVRGEHKVGDIAQWEKTGGKHVLKEAARDVIPAEVIDRPKGYFPVPALKYLRGDYLEMVRETLHTDAAKRRTLFQADYVQSLLDNPEDHITPLRGSKLWQVALLERWLQVHGVE